jgi:hypothetical protein
MNAATSPKRLVVVAVIDNIRRVQALLTDKKVTRGIVATSWSKQHEYATTEGVTGVNWTKQDQKHMGEAQAGYDRDVEELEKELKNWETALGHALDSLEGRV